jgi:hypothetical protein
MSPFLSRFCWPSRSRLRIGRAAKIPIKRFQRLLRRLGPCARCQRQDSLAAVYVQNGYLPKKGPPKRLAGRKVPVRLGCLSMSELPETIRTDRFGQPT